MNNKNFQPNQTAQLEPALNRAPEKLHHIHLMGICGTAMASLAGLLKTQGYQVSGSDQNAYPPMSDQLKELGIGIIQGYRAENLLPNPDLVIVGNVITRLNPEAIELSRLKIPYLSLPQAMHLFAMRDKKSIVICGTHGKTTTTALCAWALEQAGQEPGFMVGGIPQNFQKSFKIGLGPYFVIEGDEYDTAFFDKGPKFFHYNPWIVIWTSIEFDHADIYQDLEQILVNFRKLIDLIPAHGLLIANADSPLIMAESKRAQCPVITYGLQDPSHFQAHELTLEQEYTKLKIRKNAQDHLTLTTPLFGRHNIANLLAVVALCDYLKVRPEALQQAAHTFQGVKRRQEIRGEKRGILVIDDFAHHPTAVKETILAVKNRYSGRRLLAVFEPRSNSSRRNVFQAQYAEAFDQADVILIPEPGQLEKIPVQERFSSSQLVQNLREKGLQAFCAVHTDELLEQIMKRTQKGDVILIMSNGSFDNLVPRLLSRLES